MTGTRSRDVHRRMAEMGTATVAEADPRVALLDTEFMRVVPASRAAGPARTVRCGQDDHLMVHVAIAQMRPGDVLVLTMPRPAPVALVGDLIATQAKVHGAAALLVDAAVRDVDALADIGLPVWARWIRVHGSGKSLVGDLDIPVAVGGAVIRSGDLVVMDGDGVVVVEEHLVPQVHDAAVAREERERVRRAQLLAGALVYDLDDLQHLVEGVAHEQQA